MMKKLLFSMLLLLMMAIGAVAQQTLTVYDGTTTSSYVPMYGGYFDDFTRTQFVIPAEDLTDMEGGQISEIKFYTNSQNVPYTTVSSVDVYLMEVDYTSISAYEAKADAQIVYSGFIEFVSADGGGETTITFESPYTYNGGNLLIGCENTTDAGYKFIYFYGQTVNNASISASNSSSLANVTPTQRNFIPKTTFTYTPGAPASCPRPTELAKSSLTARTVDLAWTNGADETAWQIYISNAPGSENIIDVTTNPYTLTDLTPETTYLVKVRANCGSEQSNWSNTVNFTTLQACPAPTAFVFSNITNNYVSMSWTPGASESHWNFQYKKSSEENWGDVIEVTNNPTTYISGLDAGTTYNVRVQADCESEGTSTAWLTGSFSTSYGIPFVEEFAENSIPADWSKYVGLIDATLSTTTSGWNLATVTGVFDGSKHIKVNVFGTNCKYWLVTPNIAMDANVELRFNLALTDYANADPIEDPTAQQDDKFVVLVSTDNGETWTILRQYDNAGSEFVYNNIPTAGEEVVIDLASYSTGTIKIAFYAESTQSGGDNDLRIDNVSIDYIHSCAKPTALAYSNVTARTADLSWTEGDAETSWQICLDDDEDNLVEADSNPFTLTGLTPETTYRVKVRANCGGDVSAWTSNVSFTTGIACQVPTALVYTDVTNVSATISWTPGASESLWNFMYKATTAEEWTEVNGLTDPTYTITGLTGGTSYNVKVQADCESEGTSGLWLQGTFTTAYGIPFVEGFGTSMPANWAQYTGLLSDVMDGTALQTTTYAWSFGSNNGVFDNHARVNIYGTYQRWLTTPAIIMDANVQLTFDLALTAYSGTGAASGTCDDDKFVVLISTDNGATWTILRQYDNAGSEYVYNNIPTAGEEVVIDLTSYSTGNVIIAFYGESTVTGNGDNNLHIDNVRLDYIPATTYTITATAGENGTITPAGAVLVDEGDEQAFTITPDAGYQIASVMVDTDNDVTATVVANNGVYTFTNVTADHTIAATFEVIPATTYTITATAGENGTITPAGAVPVDEGDEQAFTITPDAGYQIASVMVDTDNDVTDELEYNDGVYTYTFENVVANHTIHATFEVLQTYTITVNITGNGEVVATDEDDNVYPMENGVVTVNNGADVNLEITPAENYQIESVTIDGVPEELEQEDLAGYSYSFFVVDRNHIIDVTFVPADATDMIDAASMAIYPNPNNGMFSIDFSNIEGDATYEIIDVRGAVVETRSINVMNGATMNFSHNLDAGTYFVRIISGDKVYVEQIVVE